MTAYRSTAGARRWSIAVGLATGLAALLVPAAVPLGTVAQAPRSGPVDLLSQADIRLDGAAAGDLAGASIAAAGDVNGDGLTDIVIGAPRARNNGRIDSGSAYVVYGRSTPGTIDLAALGNGGFRIDGAAADDGLGTSVAGADVNGDGRADVILGAFRADDGAQVNSGAVYVIYGSPSHTTIDLSTAPLHGTDGFRIRGAVGGDQAGIAVAGAGDLTGDGRAEIIIGASHAHNNNRFDSGSAYVVYGAPSSGGFNLTAIGAYGFRIDGALGDSAGYSVAGGGDVNGDGRPDLVVGAPFGSSNGRGGNGSVYVVYGTAASGTLDLTIPSPGFFRVTGEADSDNAGISVALGNVTGDGRSEVIIGAQTADGNGRSDAGSVYVVFGAPSSGGFNLSLIGAYGFRIDGAQAEDNAGSSVSSGDIDGDGRVDVLVGASLATHNRRTYSGAAYVVYGRTTFMGPVDLAALGQAGLRIDGAVPRDQAGDSLASGDVNGDGRFDVLVGALRADRGGVDSGAAYVVFGAEAADATAPSLVLTGPLSQRILIKDGATVRAACSESCTLKARAFVTISGSQATLSLKPARGSLGSAGSVVLKLALTPAAGPPLAGDPRARIRAFRLRCVPTYGL